MSKYDDKMWGVQVSECAMENGKCDYNTIIKAFSCVPFTMMPSMWERLELANGKDAQDNKELVEVYEYMFIDQDLYEVLADETNELVYFDPMLNVYVWGITKKITSWDDTLTEIPLREIEE